MGSKDVKCRYCGEVTGSFIDICQECAEDHQAQVRCPICGADAVEAPGGAIKTPSLKAMRAIQYLCTNGECLNEFGDADIAEAEKTRLESDDIPF
jgi:ribosomal protein S27E